MNNFTHKIVSNGKEFILENTKINLITYDQVGDTRAEFILQQIDYSEADHDNLYKLFEFFEQQLNHTAECYLLNSATQEFDLMYASAQPITKVKIKTSAEEDGIRRILRVYF